MSPGKCGCDCIHCPSYKDNIRTIEDKQNCSSGWENYLNIHLSPEKLRACDGCSIPDSQRKTFYLNCTIRKCAMINRLENCAFCAGFPCDELVKVHSIQQVNKRDEYIKKTGKEISENDYKLFVEPYAGLYHLNKIRETLSDRDIWDYKRFSTNVSFASFDNSKANQESLLKIYYLLTTICIEKDISYARQQTLETKRERLLKLLWATCFFGTFNKDSGCIELDSNTFMSQKIHGMYETLLEYLNELKLFGIHGEVIPIIKTGWLTPMGGLRKNGWMFRLKFGDSLNGKETLHAFINYINRLNTKYGNKAYRYFNTADLCVMID